RFPNELTSRGIAAYVIDPESSRMNMMFGAGYGVPDCNGTAGIGTSVVAAETGPPIKVATHAKATTIARCGKVARAWACFIFLVIMDSSWIRASRKWIAASRRH